MDHYSKLLFFMVWAFCAHSADAREADRAQTWEFGIDVIAMSSENLSGTEGSALNVDSEIGWGFMAGYNFTNRFALAFDANWFRPDYSASRIIENTRAIDTIQAELDIVNFQLKGVFNVLDRALTPFVELGVGWTDVDSNIITGPPTTGCWWDPWWGYICDTFFTTYGDTRTSYMAAAGLRWDLPNGLSLKAAYARQEVDTSRATDDASLDTWRVQLSWRR